MTIDPVTAVAKNGSITVHVTVSPANNQTPINLALATDAGTTGLATFDNGAGTRQITQTTVLTIKGVTESSVKDNVSLTATAEGSTKGKIKFSVLWVVLSFRYGSTLSVSNDNAAKAHYVLRFSTDKLGIFHDLNESSPLWVTSVEILGTVFPHDFTSNLPIMQEVVGYKDFNDKVTIGRGGGYPDVRDADFFDDDPQSGMSDGKVYGLDAPGIGSKPQNPVGSILRNRTNFRDWVMFGNQKVSDDLLWFSRISIRKSSSGDELIYDPLIELNYGDNKAGLGTTALTWNLGAERSEPALGASIIDNSHNYTAWLYRDFFDREPDQSGWDAWSAYIDQCGTDSTCIYNARALVGRDFLLSAEFLSSHPDLANTGFGTHAFNEAFVEQCYLVFLRRPSEQAGKTAWVQILDNSAPNTTYTDYDQVVSGFIGSIEYRVRFPATGE